MSGATRGGMRLMGAVAPNRAHSNANATAPATAPVSACAPAFAALVLLSLLSAACSPALNWREVRLHGLSTLLPCKPDTATRPINLGDVSLNMEMAGCETAGALFAISHIQAADAQQAPIVMERLRAANLATLQSDAPPAAPHSGDAQTSVDEQVQGKRPNGETLQARFKWMVNGRDIYQIAVYAKRLSAEQTDTILTEARIR